jgi:hypothetical protein
MTTQKTTLRIKAHRLGKISDIIDLLNDLEKAYNSIYAFDFLVNTLSNDQERRNGQNKERINLIRKLSREFNRKEFLFDPYFHELFVETLLFNRSNDNLPNLIEIQRKIEIEKIVLPHDSLYISKVNIQSPGFWEILGSLNPLLQIKEGLKDYHERKKDKNYRSRQEEALGELAIIEKKESLLNTRIDTLKKLGYSDAEIKHVVYSMVIEPLNILGKHQDNGQIEGLEEL